MAFINENYLKLQGGYLFSEIAKRVRQYKESNPKAKVINMGIGDVTRPLPKAVIEAMQEAVSQMGEVNTFKGYGPEQGYDFLLNAIAVNDYQKRGIDISVGEIFVSDGAKSDTGNILDILGNDNIIAVTDPIYPVYVDTNVMAGRAGNLIDEKWDKLVYLSCTAQNDFVPELPKQKIDIVYLCFPNNPMGTTLTIDQLKVWVDYAVKNRVLILFDAAYEAFVTEKNVPRSIYEIEEAKKVAIEFRSFSKTAGFTGTRCAYTIVPKELMGYTKAGEKIGLNRLWNRRHATKFNGVSYIIQKGAEACYFEEGKKQIQESISYYLKNAKTIKEGLKNKGFNVYGGINSPYVWVKSPKGTDSWGFFDYLLHELNIAGTPGVGFGLNGEGYLRLSAFNSMENTRDAILRFK